MTDPIQRIDPAIYRAKPLTVGAAPERSAETYTPPAAVPAELAVAGSELLARGAAARQEAGRELASPVESAGAAVSQWLPMHVADYVRTPTFAADPNFDAAAFLRQVDFRLDPSDEQFLMKATSGDDAAHRLSVLRDRNTAHAAMGDNPVTAFIAGAIDPTYLAIDVASLGAARLLNAGRLGAAGIAAGATVGAGMVESQLTPTTTTQIVLNAAMMGAAAGLTFRNGKLVETNPGYPHKELDAAFAEVRDGKPLPESHPDFVGPLPEQGVRRAEENLTRPAVPATGEGPVKVQYSAGRSAEDLTHEYDPAISLSRSEQAALYTDGVTAVRTVDDIAQHSRAVELGRTVIDKDAKAVYLPGEDRVFLVRENIKPGDDVKGILLHEVGVHMNAERVLGTARMGEMLGRLEELAKSGNARAKQAFNDVPRDTPLHLQREEALGYYIERNHRVVGDGIVGKFSHAVKEFLRRVGLKGLKLSENDIVQLVRKAAKSKAPGSFDATFPYAWHGSPTRGIEQLDTAFMGTGEGAQAFGWGHYLTAEKGTALDYRNKEAIRRGLAPEDGGLYRVKINAEAHQFLDLDARVQSPHVQGALSRLGVRQGVTGKAAYDYLAKKLGGARQAAEALYREGVAGNKYTTGKTRSAAVKNSNFVVFSNDVLDVAARYSKGARAVNTTREAVKLVSSSASVAKAIEWSWHKTMSRHGEKAKEVADLLMDSPTATSGNSAASIQRALRADLAEFQYKYEGILLDTMGKRGMGLFQRITQPAQAVKVQQAIERDVYMEMLRRNRAARDGLSITNANVPKEVTEMANALDALSKRSLQELKAAGVAGADQVDEMAGYVTRRWDIAKMEAIEARLLAQGPMSPADVRLKFVDTISVGIQRATGWDAQVATDVAGAIYDRTKRKGQFQDAEFHANMGEDSANQLRTLLAAEGLQGARLERVMDVLAGKADEAGKMPSMKSRVDMRMDETMLLPDGSSVTIADMLDTNVSALTERYLDTVSARAALARKGLGSPTEIANMRKQLAQSVPDLTARAEAVQSFDEALNVLQGNPVGEEMLSGLRNVQAVTQMVGLASSGLWQLTEYATIMARHGAGRVVKEMLAELPFVRDMVKHESTSLREVLARNSSQDTRLRPFINRMEDNFEIPMSDSVKLALMQSKQLVPYANAMKYIQHHQARVSANLMVDVLNRAANGDAKALNSLAEYGLESGSMGKVAADIRAHGMDTAKWSDATWQEVRGPLTKMMDDAVLRARLGEMPQFAHTSTVGKFLFTFRSFVLAAHNKVLANTLTQQGYAGLGLLLLYQVPLTVLATAANTGLSGKPQEDLLKTAHKAFGQVGAMGLFGELYGVIAGTKQQFGAPGLIAVDRLYKAVGSLGDGQNGTTPAALLHATPVLSAILPVRAVSEALKENKDN